MSGEADLIAGLLAEARPRLWRAFVVVRGIGGADDATAEASAWSWENADRLAELRNPVGYLYRVGLTAPFRERHPAILLTRSHPLTSLRPFTVTRPD